MVAQEGLSLEQRFLRTFQGRYRNSSWDGLLQ